MDLSIVLAAATVFSLGAISPGPSLMVVLRNTLTGGRRLGMACAVGHGIGFGIYAFLAVFGLLLMLESYPFIFTSLQYTGCVLLVWFGWKMWNHTIQVEAQPYEEETLTRGFAEGFSIAFFNPKIAVFLLAVLSQILRPGMSELTKFVVGMTGMFIDTLWYLIVAFFFSANTAERLTQRYGTALSRLTAFVLWTFAASVLFS